MVTVGEKEYLEENNFKIWKNTYLKKDSKFEGKTMFYTLGGEYINGWTWEKGKVVYDLKVSDSEADLELQLRSCGYTTITVSSEECYIETTFGESDCCITAENSEEICETTSYKEVIFNECPPATNDPNADSGGVNDPSNSSGGGSYTGPTSAEGGQDWFFDETYWNNPYLTFQTQALPSYISFYNAFPKRDDGSGAWLYGADNVYGRVGGAVLQARIDSPNSTGNTCALKVSIALNGSGVNIPNIPGVTLEGADGKFYFLNAKALSEWMKKTFPSPAYDTYTNPNQSVQSLLGSRSGIIISLYGNGMPSGHADIYTGQGCASYSHCAMSGTVLFWEL